MLYPYMYMYMYFGIDNTVLLTYSVKKFKWAFSKEAVKTAVDNLAVDLYMYMCVCVCALVV